MCPQRLSPWRQDTWASSFKRRQCLKCRCSPLCLRWRQQARSPARHPRTARCASRRPKFSPATAPTAPGAILFRGFLTFLGRRELFNPIRRENSSCVYGTTGTILPMIVTPLIGSLVLFWMIDSQGIIGASIQILFDDPNLSLKASSNLTWITLIIYGIWHNTPFAFVVFYAALQTVPQDPLEAAFIDGASRFERVRFIVIPHLYPVATFIMLICLMDNFRVFEPIIGFSAEGVAQSLSWMIYQDLRNENKMLFGSAGATSMLTILGIAFLLTPVLIRTWKEFKTER